MPLTVGQKAGWTPENQFIVEDPDGTYGGAAVTLTYFRNNQSWFPFTSKTANYTVPDTTELLGYATNIIDCTANSFTITFPDASADNVGRAWVVVNSGSGTITLTTTGGTQIFGNDGVSTSASLAAGASKTVVSSGSGYRLI